MFDCNPLTMGSHLKWLLFLKTPYNGFPLNGCYFKILNKSLNDMKIKSPTTQDIFSILLSFWMHNYAITDCTYWKDVSTNPLVWKASERVAENHMLVKPKWAYTNLQAKHSDIWNIYSSVLAIRTLKQLINRWITKLSDCKQKYCKETSILMILSSVILCCSVLL